MMENVMTERKFAKLTVYPKPYLLSGNSLLSCLW